MPHRPSPDVYVRQTSSTHRNIVIENALSSEERRNDCEETQHAIPNVPVCSKRTEVITGLTLTAKRVTSRHDTSRHDYAPGAEVRMRSIFSPDDIFCHLTGSNSAVNSTCLMIENVSLLTSYQVAIRMS
jgi:hypothetical protein